MDKKNPAIADRGFPFWWAHLDSNQGPNHSDLCSFFKRLKMKKEINFDVFKDGSESQVSHLIYFDVRFRMSANIHAISLESALDKIYDYSERELLNFDERDAPEITIHNVF